MLVAAARIAKEKGLHEKGYRLVGNCLESAGQSVFHVHVHLLGGRRFSWPPG
jgi:histidine triad (HIT) family protein